MYKIVFLLCLFVCGINAFSQRQYFVYIQADERQPFYARISNKIYSSSESGYLIIPRLGDSTYAVTIGFARNVYPEEKYVIAISKADKGFQLKKSGSNLWSLYNLQTMATIAGTVLQEETHDELTGTRKTDAFSQLLANVVNDSSVLYTLAIPAEPAKEKKPAPVTRKDEGNTAVAAHPDVATVIQPPAEKKDTVALTVPAAVTAGSEDKKDPVAAATGIVMLPEAAEVQKKPAASAGDSNKQEREKPFITRIDEHVTAVMYEATYLEQYILTTDTIQIRIALQDMPAAPQQPIAKTTGQPVKTVAEKPARESTVTDTTGTQTATQPVAEKKKPAIVILNSDCNSIATEHDVDKLRVKLLAQETIDDKLIAALKYFRTKCFMVSQVRALTELFPNDDTRYRFYDTAYPYVSDTANFYTLEEMIQNEYYKNRFKAMIHK